MLLSCRTPHSAHGQYIMSYYITRSPRQASYSNAVAAPLIVSLGITVMLSPSFPVSEQHTDEERAGHFSRSSQHHDTSTLYDPTSGNACGTMLRIPDNISYGDDATTGPPDAHDAAPAFEPLEWDPSGPPKGKDTPANLAARRMPMVHRLSTMETNLDQMSSSVQLSTPSLSSSGMWDGGFAEDEYKYNQADFSADPAFPSPAFRTPTQTTNVLPPETWPQQHFGQSNPGSDEIAFAMTPKPLRQPRSSLVLADGQLDLGPSLTPPTDPEWTRSSLPESSKPINSRKRKPLATDGTSEPVPSPGRKPTLVKKTTHNMVEKRYRVNLNSKMAALRDRVPSLRETSSGGAEAGDDQDEDDEDLAGPVLSAKPNKGVILVKAMEHMEYLETRNEQLVDENDVLRDHLEAFQRLALSSPTASTRDLRARQRSLSPAAIDPTTAPADLRRTTKDATKPLRLKKTWDGSTVDSRRGGQWPS